MEDAYLNKRGTHDCTSIYHWVMGFICGKITCLMFLVLRVTFLKFKHCSLIAEESSHAEADGYNSYRPHPGRAC